MIAVIATNAPALGEPPVAWAGETLIAVGGVPGIWSFIDYLRNISESETCIRIAHLPSQVNYHLVKSPNPLSLLPLEGVSFYRIEPVMRCPGLTRRIKKMFNPQDPKSVVYIYFPIQKA